MSTIPTGADPPLSSEKTSPPASVSRKSNRGGRYWEVAVNSPGGRAQTFVYSSGDQPDDDLIGVGSLALVPFGGAEAQGIVVAEISQPPDLPIRKVSRLLDGRPVLSPVQISLARWLGEHYCCPLIDALTLLLPPGVAQRPQTYVSLVSGVSHPKEVSEGEFAVLTALQQKPRLELSQIRHLLATKRLARQTEAILRRLGRLGVLRRETTVRPATTRPLLVKDVRLAEGIDAETALAALSRAPRQRDALARLIRAGPGATLPLATLRDDGLAAASVIAGLRERGLIRIEEREVRRDPLVHRTFPRHAAPNLTLAQAAAVRTIEAALDQPGYHPFLLYGITGSGKTEVYLRMIESLLARGKRAIVLVPEISLTPQTIQRFAGRFPGRVAVLHSRLSPGERFDEWRWIRSGQATVVVGSRSALFAPVAELGGIIVDEEHEWSYKQEKSPRYHARDVALKLAELAGLPVVLGSATPSLESFEGARRGRLRLLELPERVEVARQRESRPHSEGEGDFAKSTTNPSLDLGLPPVELVDLRAELRAGNRSIFSASLRNAIDLALSLREQVILFLNRRGDSTFVLCRDCGYVMRCERCDAPLVYHSDVEDLICHLCDARRPVPKGCPSCWGERIRYFGIGTQKLETETRQAFPQARVLRWDRDAASARGAHEELLRQFVNHEADILVGTQMIAKGLDLPRVTLVGIISADTSLHLPDFRAVERTFQLLTQVAGRAGRGPLGGKVILQTYNPEHYCIQAAQQHDYQAFFDWEIRFRREHGYPPFGELARLLYVGYGESRVEREAEDLASQIRAVLHAEGIADVDLIGPAPAFHRKVRGRYRWQIVLRGHGLSQLIPRLVLTPGWTVDVDPVSTL
ncbi:MAG TPA: primosomal protein N' [Chloroflexota bacterium]|nr:primosomal protein N' [Chloroflexota bacterium]